MSRDGFSAPSGASFELLEQRLMLSGIPYWDLRYIDPLPGDSQTYAVDFNNVGEVLAVSESDQLDRHVMLWRDGQQTDITAMLPDLAGMEYPPLCAVNDAGQVAGTTEWGVGGFPGNRAFLLDSTTGDVQYGG